MNHEWLLDVVLICLALNVVIGAIEAAAARAEISELRKELRKSRLGRTP